VHLLGGDGRASKIQTNASQDFSEIHWNLKALLFFFVACLIFLASVKNTITARHLFTFNIF